MIGAPPLLGAKLLPPELGRSYLGRPRLVDRLRANLKARATVVVAGPGYGKTSFVAEFLKRRGTDSVYYRLDESDRDPWVFFRYLVHGIREHVPDFGERSEGLWAETADREVDVARLTDSFIRDAEEMLGGEMVIVLDDVHCIDSGAACTGAVKRLLAYLPGTLHLILIGRSLPEFGLRALTMDGSVGLIEGKEILFTLQETQALLTTTFGLALQPEGIRRVHERTLGWVTALRLLRQTARLDARAEQIPEEIFTRTEAEIFSYFSEEVFAAETGEARRFLLESSPPPILDPEICAEVIDGMDVRAVLADLVRRNLFLGPLESRGEYYAYDPLFREYLVRKLRAEAGAEAKRVLDSRYGRAFSRRGDFSRALEHFREAGDAVEVGELLAKHGVALVRSGMHVAVREAAAFDPTLLNLAFDGIVICRTGVVAVIRHIQKARIRLQQLRSSHRLAANRRRHRNLAIIRIRYFFKQRCPLR